eukprot:TRINITY_DN9903_c0_g1_i4.p1 TRINITY_DN9903_c0_g1~~TRINITY_DN9903_c0_g1_i4.p1  ORF type:complete len:126 (-),score=38.00 TRINITY_DN9903_c0_g1_i4:608-985(-)
MALAGLIREVRFIGSRVRVWTNPGAVAGHHPVPEKVIIFLHGSGITGFGMEKWLASLVKPYPGTVVVLPSAPMREYMLEGKRSSVWHQRKEVDIEAVDEDLVGIDEMCEGLHEMVENMRTIGAEE